MMNCLVKNNLIIFVCLIGISTSSTGDTKHSKSICESKRSKYLRMNDDDLYQLASSKGVGNCKLEDASNCPTCACGAYLKVPTAEWPGKGWSLDPETKDSTGCVEGLAKTNGIEMVRDALRNKNDICGLCNPHKTITRDMALENVKHMKEMPDLSKDQTIKLPRIGTPPPGMHDGPSDAEKAQLK